MTSCSLCGALPFDVNLFRNRRLHKGNDIIWGSLCWGGAGLLLLPSLSKQGTIIPSVTFLFPQRKKYSSPSSPVHIQNHLPIPVCSYLSHIPTSYLHLHLKNTPYCIYIYYDYTRFFFFLLWMFLCCTPILFGSLLVALMWNVCAEPIECCVYIKATLFLTIPTFMVCVWV